MQKNGINRRERFSRVLILTENGGKGFPSPLEGTTVPIEFKQIVGQTPHLPFSGYVFVSSH